MQNLALLEPADYFYTDKDRYVRRISPPGPAEFYLVGTVMLSSLLGGARDKNRQLCLRPMWELLGRATSFVGALLKKKSYYVNTFRDGLSFSSMMAPRGISGHSFIHRFCADQLCLIDGKEKWDPKPRYTNTFLPFTPPGVDSEVFFGCMTPICL